MSDKKDNAPPDTIWINRGSGHLHTAVSKKSILDECEAIEYVLKSAADKQAKQKEDWFDAIIKSAYEVHKERIEEILKPVRDAWESKSGLGQFEKEGAIMPISLPFKTILLLLAKGRRSIKETLELADKLK